MSAFKDAIAADKKAVFINGDEFADNHNINGVDVVCVVDGDLITERNARTYAEYAEGVFKAQITIFVDADDLPARPVKGEGIRFDGNYFSVDDCVENMGILEITLGANEA